MIYYHMKYIYIFYIMKYIIWFIILLLVIIDISSTETYACSCMHPWTPAQAIANSDVVFVWIMSGDAVYSFSGDENNSESEFLNKKHIAHNIFIVQQWIKWVSNGETIIIESENATSCGYEYDTDLQYVIYWNYSEDNRAIIYAWLCTRTAPILTKIEDLPYTTAQEDLAYFKTINQSYKPKNITKKIIRDVIVTSPSHKRETIVVTLLLVFTWWLYWVYKIKR